MLVALKKSSSGHERKVEAIGEHNLSIVSGNWEGIIGDNLSRRA